MMFEGVYNRLPAKLGVVTFDLTLTHEPARNTYDAVLLAVPHREYVEMAAAELRAFLKDNGVLFDLKGVLPLGEANLRL